MRSNKTEQQISTPQEEQEEMWGWDEEEQPKEQPEQDEEVNTLSRCKLKLAIELVKIGALEEAFIIYNQLVSKYYIAFLRGDRDMYLLETDRGNVREFTSIDTAFKAVEKVGLQGARIIKIESDVTLPPY